MTKSGIGTQNGPQMGATGDSVANGQVFSSASSIAAAEIPIWVADKKKWVTGISKKTTINDLIYAILKQCQINAAPLSNNDSANQYVLVEYTLEQSIGNGDSIETVVTSQRVLNGDSKVYKHVNKWSQSPNSLQTNNLMLKILYRQPNNEKNENTDINSGSQSSSLATKLLKKFGVSSSSPATNSIMNSKSSSASNSNLNNQSLNFRYVDVKLPNPNPPIGIMTSNQQSKHTSTAALNAISPAASSSNSTSTSTNSANIRNFDPNVQKTFLFNSIIEKDSKLKNQVKRIQLIDEILKEAEKSSKYSGLALESSNYITNPTYSPAASDKLPPNIVDLNDIYCHFPEMCTHHLKEVEDFTFMCCQLFQLEEAIKSQKQILTGLEMDLQKELNQSQSYLNSSGNNLNIQNIDSPETMELRKEVNMSREQTRLQCKQLHDLDLRMRQNEQSLMMKEQQLQQLLEELYIQEIYADNAIESAITNTKNTSSNNTINLGENSQQFTNPHMSKSEMGDNANMGDEDDSEEMGNEFSRDDAHHGLPGVELVINNERLIINNNGSNQGYESKKYNLDQNDALIRRQMRVFGDNCNDDMFSLKQHTQPNPSNKNFNNQIGMNSLNPQHKSFSYGNLTTNNNINQLNNSNNKIKTINLKNSPSSDLIVSNNNISNNNNESNVKSIKINNNLQSSDQSGDNDSGISSMSSETNATIMNTLQPNTNPTSFHQFNVQKPTTVNPFTNNNNNNNNNTINNSNNNNNSIQSNNNTNNRQFLNHNHYLYHQNQQYHNQLHQNFNRQQQIHSSNQQFQHQQQNNVANSAASVTASNTTKSVLETLV